MYPIYVSSTLWANLREYCMSDSAPEITSIIGEKYQVRLRYIDDLTVVEEPGYYLVFKNEVDAIEFQLTFA